MSTSVIALIVAVLAGVGLVVTLGALSLLSGGFHFLFGQKELVFLRSQKGPNGFAFGFKWNDARQPAKFDRVRLRAFNPFGSPTQVDVTKEFSGCASDFAQDFDMGPAMSGILSLDGVNNATIQVELSSLKDGITQQFDFKANKFFKLMKEATLDVHLFNDAHEVVKAKPLFTIPKRTFISEPLPKTEKQLKIASNPIFAGEFAAAAAGGADAPAVENFSLKKVWIEPGCIVCNACEDIYPEVFEVTGDTCIVKGDAPLTDGLKVQEAAEACPVEIIKFDRA